MKIKLKNIGGIRDEEIQLKEGINVIKAPNATGKTSFTHGLKVISLNRNDLYKNTQFLNDQSSKGWVTVDGDVTVTIERQASNLDVKGTPVFDVNGKADIVFADPENEFLDTIQKGESIEGFINKFSDAKYYKEVNVKVEEVYDNLKDREADQGKDLNKLKSSLMNEKIKTSKEESRQDLKEQRKALKEREAKIIKEKGKSEEERQTGYSKKVDELRSKKQTLIDDNNTAKDLIPKLESENRRLEKDIKDLEKEQEKLSEKYGDFQAKSREMKQKIDEMKKEYGVLNNDILFDEQSLKENRTNLKGAKCGECGRDYSLKDREKRIQFLNERLRENKAKKNSLNAEITNLTKDEEYLTETIKAKHIKNKTTLQSNSNSIRDNKTEIEKAGDAIKNNKPKMDKLEEQIKEIEKLMDSTITDIKRKVEDIDQEVNDIDRALNEQEATFKEYEITEKKYQALKKKTKFLEELKAFIKDTIINLQKTVINNFNDSIIKVYEKLNFKDFTGITIDPYTYKIKINRKGLKENQDLNRLSTSERITLGVVVMIVGKESYMPEFPFFVLDEIVTSYDPERFKKIINYISDKTPYTIVTAFSSSGDKIKVEYSL